MTHSLIKRLHAFKKRNDPFYYGPMIIVDTIDAAQIPNYLGL
jgi:hypothetical protein